MNVTGLFARSAERRLKFEIFQHGNQINSNVNFANELFPFLRFRLLKGFAKKTLPNDTCPWQKLSKGAHHQKYPLSQADWFR